MVDRDRYSDHAAHKTREQLKVVREDCGAGAEQITPDQRHNLPCKQVDTVLCASKGVSHQPYWRITIPRDLDDELASRESQPLGGWESRPKEFFWAMQDKLAAAINISPTAMSLAVIPSLYLHLTALEETI